MCAVVGRIQLAAEMRGPAGVAAERREEGRGAFGDRQVNGAAEIGDRELLSGDPLEQRRRDPKRE